MIENLKDIKNLITSYEVVQRNINSLERSITAVQDNSYFEEDILTVKVLSSSIDVGTIEQVISDVKLIQQKTRHGILVDFPHNETELHVEDCKFVEVDLNECILEMGYAEEWVPLGGYTMDVGNITFKGDIPWDEETILEEKRRLTGLLDCKRKELSEIERKMKGFNLI